VPLPLRRCQTQTGTAAMSPPRRLPLVGLLALRSFVCARPPGLLVTWARSAFPFPVSRSVLLRAPSPAPCEAGSSSRELSLPCRVLPIRARLAPAVERGRLPWGSVPLRDINQRCPLDTRFPCPASVPSSAFRTPSTVCSATGLAGLFHPAAASRVRSPGVFPSVKPCRLVDDPYPRRWRLLAVERLPAQRHDPALRLQGALSTEIRCGTDGV